MKTSMYSVLFDYENDATYVVDKDSISFGAPLYKALQFSTLNPHQAADDYSIWNSENGADDMRKEGAKLFGAQFMNIEYELDGFAMDEEDNQVILTNLEVLGLEDKESEILSFMERWENENACYTEADYMIWFDGSNYKVTMLNEDYSSSCGSMEVLDGFEENPILSALDHVLAENPNWERERVANYGGYEFTIPEGSYHFEYCSVRKLDE